MTTTDMVSIGMPVFNGGVHLHDSIDSLLGQTYGNIELIISDNASTDATEEICRDYAARDERVRYIRNRKNFGASDNYNAVFQQARGALFKWASCNDVCESNFIARCVHALRSNLKAVCAYPQTRLIDREKGMTQDYADGMQANQENACARFRAVVERMGLNNAMNGVIRAECLRQTELIRPYFSSDVVMMAALALHGKLLEVPDYLFFRSMDERTATALKSKDEVRRHYNPSGNRRMLFQQWKIQAGYFRAIRKASLPRHEKRCLYQFLMRSTYWAKRDLWRDLIEVMTPYALRQPRHD